MEVGAQAIGQAAGSLVVPAVDGGKGIFNCLKRKYGYVKNMSENFADLEREEKYLCDEEVDVKTELDRNKLKMEKTRRCETWLNEVEKIKVEVETLKADYRNTPKFFCGLCPFHGLSKLGKQIVKKKSEVLSLKNQISQITKMVEKAPTPVIRKHAKKIEDVPSLKKHVDMLQECLRNEDLKRICIWGPPGVGKSTIMENLHDAVGESRQFDIIFWVTVTTGDIRDIQYVLLKRLDLRAEEYNNDQRAYMISEELKSKSYLLFLDEVSSEINLKEIGIHDEHRHGKVVFACRSRNICGHTDEDINVQRLSDEDAQKLFWETVGGNLKDNRDIKRVARFIINECGGMPNMIKLIGKRLANVSSLAIWRDTLKQLRSPSNEPKQEFEEVYKFFKLVCDKLHSKKQPCLLYWAIFPTGCELHENYIIDCWRAEQFLTHLEKLGEARDRGNAILEEFVQKSLLEKGRNVAHYKMFEHFQRVALRIANHENNYKILVKEGERIREEEWQHANRISLCGLCLSTLPKRPECCRILTLLLQECNLAEIPRSFFGYMCSLQLLDLNHARIRLLPSSISSLINLKALLLNSCSQLMQLPAEVGYLHSLEILDIRHTGIHSLPSEIGQLTNLKCLRVSFMEKTVGNHNHFEAGLSEMISSNVIARLYSLEELSIYVKPNDIRWNQIVDNIANEIAALKDLTTLCFYFPKVDCFQTFINTSKSWNGHNTESSDNCFRSFSIHVGYHQRSSPVTEVDISGFSAEKQFRFSNGEGFPDAVLKILEQASLFELIGHHTATNLSDFDSDKLGRLEACIIEDCSEMTSIIDTNLTRGVAFQLLKKLHIKNLPKLINIWKGSIESQSLSMLTTLTVKGCHSVKMLLSHEMVLRLQKLQYLQVENCKELEEVINVGSVVETMAFPKLKNLELIDLPSLSNICHNVSLAWPSLETIIIKTCEKLNIFPFTIESATKLRVICCSQAWWNQLDWPNANVRDRDHFQSFHQII